MRKKYEVLETKDYLNDLEIRDDVWLGLASFGQFGKFYWMYSRKSPSYENWLPGNPSNETIPNPSCVLMDSDHRKSF